MCLWMANLHNVIYKQINPVVKKIWNDKCGCSKTAHWGNFVNSFYKQKQNVFKSGRAWFLKIDPVWIVGMRVCVCVCVCTRGN